MDSGNQTGTFSPHQDVEAEHFGSIAFTTSTPSNPTRRSGRKSWFDNLGNMGKGTKYEIAVEKTVKRRSVGRRKSEEDDIEILTLTHFTNPPRIGFGRAKPGTIKRRSLLIKNPHEYPQDVKVEKFPFKKHFDIDETRFTVEAEGTLLLTITWSPEEEGNFREMILLQVDGSYRLQAFVFGCVEKPAPKKKVRKGLMGRATKKPFAIIQTPSLANIAKSYSPTKGEARKSGDGHRRLSKGRENKVPVKKTVAKNQDAFHPKQKHSLVPNEERNGCLDSNIKISHITPIKPAEDTVSSAEFVVPKVVKMPGKSSVKKLKDDYQEELESLSPLVAKYLDNSDDDVIVVRQTVNSEDGTNQLNTPDRMSNNLDTPIRILSTKPGTPRNVTVAQENKPYKSDLNTPDKVLEKTPDKGNKWYDTEEKTDALSPNSFLHDSLCSQRGIDTSLYDAGSTISRQPAHSTILPTPERMSRAVNEPMNDFISPNKFLKELNDTQEKLELSFQHDPNTIPSPESILNSSIPHAIMVKQLQTVKMSLATPNPVFSPLPLNNKRETFVLKSAVNVNQSPALRRETFIKKRSAIAPKPVSSNPKSTMVTRQGNRKTTKEEVKSRDVPIMKKARKGNKDSLCKKTIGGKFKHDRISEDSLDGAILGSPIPTHISSTSSIYQEAINTPELLVNSNTEAMANSASVKTTEGSTSMGRRLFTPCVLASPPYTSENPVFESPNNLADDMPAAKQLLNEASDSMSSNMRKEKHDRMSKDSLDESISVVNSATVTKEKPLSDIAQESRTSSGKKLFTQESGVSPSHDSSFQSPSTLPDDTPMRELFTRRATLTVTKQRPSDALVQVTQERLSSQLIIEDIAPDNTVHSLSCDSPRLHTVLPEENPERCISLLLKNNKTSHSLGQTPTEVSVSSSINKSSSFTLTPHQLPTSPNPDHSRRSTHVVEKPKVLDLSIIGRKRLFPPLEDPDIEAVNPTDNLTIEMATATHGKEVSSKLMTREHSDQVTLDIENLSQQANEEKSHKDLNNCEVSSKPEQEKSCVPEVGKEQQQTADKTGTISHERKPYVAFITGSPVNPTTEKPIMTNKTKESVKKRTHSENRAVSEASNKRLRSTESLHTGLSGKVQSTSKSSHTTGKPRLTRSTKVDTKTSASVKPSNKVKCAVKGVAQTKLILMKKARPTALPKHPMPFASKNMYYDERWIDKQERGFVHWLNFVLTPADDYQHNNKQVKVDAGALSVEANRTSVKLAPSREVLSIRAYTARRRLNQLRRSACNLFQTKEIIHVIQKLEAEIESLRLVVRKDKKVHADLGMKQNILDMILSFNPLWLRIGLETVYGEMIQMQNNSDVLSMSRFIVTRMLSNPDIASQYCHPTVPHLYRDGYAEAIAQHLLKKFFMLIFFLDKAKSHRLINHDPCLFCKDSEYKSTKAMLIEFSRNYLSGEGDVTKHLGYLGYVVTHQQTSMDEFDYAVTNLATDLRDGVRLTRVLELLTNRWDLSKTLRAPAISRLQKVHNMEVVFKALTAQGVTFDKEKKITTKDLVDGHREKTLHVLWALILQYQVDVLLNKDQLKEEINILQRSLSVRNQLAALQRYEQGLSKKRRESAEQDLHLQSDSLLLLLRWCRTVCAFYHIKIENFTVSFGDGRAMCALVHHYHPALLPWDSINTRTTLTYQEDLEEEMCNRNLDLNSSEVFSPAPFPVAEDPVLFEEFLSNEKANFKLLYEKVSELGGIPLMLRSMDMSNTIPDEKVVVTYICYLCARLLDIRHESRAARVIQLAWRRHYLKKSKKELQMKHDAAIVIQRAVRNLLRARLAIRNEEGAKVLQKYVRGWLAQRTVAKLKAAKEEKYRTTAASVLQAAVRKWLKKQMAARKAAAVRIQAAWRCHMQRESYRRIKSACIILQKQTRMYLKKSHYIKVRQAVVCIQQQYRAHHSMEQQRKEYLQIRSAAITLQSRYRSLVQRQKFLRLRASAVEIQAIARMWIERQRYLSLHIATVNLQRRYRARLKTAAVRKEFLLQKGAAVTIQACFRGHMARKNVRHLHAAAVTIQKHFKSFQEHKRYLKVKSAIISIQRWKRAITQSRLARSEFNKVKTSVLKIQSAYRGHRARSDFLTKRSAAITFQTYIRRHQKMIAYRKLKDAVTIIQRRFKARREGEKMRREFLVQKGAAMTIQAFYRGYRVREQIKHLHSAASKIGAAVKGHLQRKRFLRLRNSALVIQRKFTANLEGRRARKDFLIKKGAALTIQAYFRGHIVRQEVAAMHLAARKIQSKVKGYLHRKRFQRLKGAAIVIQQRLAAVLLGRRLRHEFLVRKGAAMTVQAAFRGYTVRKAFVRYKEAAVVIQSQYRSHRATLLYKQQRTAIICIQRWYKNLLFTRCIKADYLCKRAAAVTIQSWYRCQTAVKTLKRDKYCVVMSQAIVRGFLQRRRFLKLRHAALVIQHRLVARRQCISMRRAFLIQKGAAMTIQAAVRGYLVRRDLQRKHLAAVVIQSVYRTHQAVSSYNKQRRAVTSIQSWYRNCLYARSVRSDYLRKKHAAVVIQKHYKSFLARRSYLHDLSNIILIQALVRGMLQRMAYRRLQWAVIVCQTRYRAVLASRQQRCRYRNLRSAATVLQSAWRRRTVQISYNKKRQAAILLQSQVRMVKDRKRFCQLKAAATQCQRLVRAKRQMQQCRRDYLITLGAIITIQAHIKSYLVQKRNRATYKSVICVQAYVRRFLAQRQYQKTYNTIVAVQKRLRANIAAKRQRNLFLAHRQAAVVIQTVFRRVQARKHMRKVQSAIMIQKTFRMFLVRQDFMRRRNAAVVLQSHHRAFLARKEMARLKLALECLQRAIKMFLFRQRLRQWMQRRNAAATQIQCCYLGYKARRYVMKTKAAIVIQSMYRMYAQRKRYCRIIKSIVLIQSGLRGTLARRRVKHICTQHSAATCIQRAYRSFKGRQAEQELRKRRMQYLEKFSGVVSAHLSVMKIQRCYRNHRVLLAAQQRLNTIITIQRWMRAKLARMRFLRFVSAVKVVQARAREYLNHRQASVIKLQAVVRGWLERRNIIRREQSVIKLQSIWRGRKVRKAYHSKKLETIRKNLKEATKTATEDKKLGNRTESALDYLLKYKQLSQILEALIHLETSTRLSPACCQRMVNVNAVGVIYRLIQSCNRSQPHMEIIRYSINILLNLAKYEKTRAAVYEVEGATECLLELMQVYREKGHIFSCSCTLMGILGMMEDQRQVVMTDKKVISKIQSIYTLTARKHKITETRMIRQAKISAAKSFNATLPILPTQKRQHRIHPAWVLQRNQMRHIEDPLQAIKFVLDNFQLTPK